MKTALITSTGSVATDITFKSLKRMGFRVVGCNIYPKEWIVESCEMDAFYQAPPVAENEKYLEFVKEICINESIDYAIITYLCTSIDKCMMHNHCTFA